MSVAIKLADAEVELLEPFLGIIIGNGWLLG